MRMEPGTSHCPHCGVPIILAAHERTGMPFALDATQLPAWRAQYELLNDTGNGHQKVGGLYRCRRLSVQQRARRAWLYIAHSEVCPKKGKR